MLHSRSIGISFMETERLFFRFYEEKDKADFIALFTDATVMKYVSDGVLTPEQTEAFWQKLFKNFIRKTLTFGRFLLKKIRAISDTPEFISDRQRKTIGNSFIFFAATLGAKVLRRRLRGG